MAIGDGGGGGGPVGFSNSFTGIAQQLEIIGEHAYAYNNTPANQTEATVFKFTSGSYYWVGTFQVNMAFGYADRSDAISIAKLTMNGGLISILTCGNTMPDAAVQAQQEIIIPPYTEVEILAKSDQNVAARLITIGLTGRIYR